MSAALLMHAQARNNAWANHRLLHVFQHQTHHRGQAHARLSATLVAPLRAAEFAALGRTEHDLWREHP